MSSSQTRPRHREVRFGNYVLGQTLGEGEFGKVKLGWRKDGGSPLQVAIKLIKRDNLLRSLEAEVKVHREINLLKMLNHPNIVKLVEVMKLGKYIGIVLEYALGGELFDYILNHKCLKEDMAKKMFAQLVSGIDYMHSKGLVHRDLKLENLLLDKHKDVVISDFGFVNSFNRDKHDYMKTLCGSPCYAAPELVLTQTPYQGTKVDVWSLGVILYAMLAGYLPFDDDPENEDGTDIVRLYRYICRTPLTFPEYVLPLARDLLRRIIVPDPRKRALLRDIRAHPWLAPYALLLSITQHEWDMVHARGAERPGALHADARSKRHSMAVDRLPHGRSYSTLYANPLAPVTLASVASAVVIPPSASLLSLNEADRQPLFAKGHARSSLLLLATNALKQVVQDHDLARVYATGIATIQESPQKVDAVEVHPQPQRLPHTKKPRPTSYHPSSFTFSMMDKASGLEYLKMLGETTGASPREAVVASILSDKENERDVVVEQEAEEEIDTHAEVTTSVTTATAAITTGTSSTSTSTPDTSPATRRTTYLEDKTLALGVKKLAIDSTPGEVSTPAPPVEKLPMPAPQSSSKRRNRFSLLSFYAPTEEPARRPLEPTSDVNRRSTTGGKRVVLVAASERSSKDLLAARRVMDFFKRRSVRG